MKLTIPENLLTTTAIYGLSQIHTNGRARFPDAAVLDDWFKDHDIDILQHWSSANYGFPSDTVLNWYQYLRFDAQSGIQLLPTQLEFLRLLEEYLPEYRSSWMADPNELETDSGWP